MFYSALKVILIGLVVTGFFYISENPSSELSYWAKDAGKTYILVADATNQKIKTNIIKNFTERVFIRITFGKDAENVNFIGFIKRVHGLFFNSKIIILKPDPRLKEKPKHISLNKKHRPLHLICTGIFFIKKAYLIQIRFETLKIF